MRVLAFTVVCLCALAAALPARALEFCDKIKDTEKRLVCLQEHISHIEESLLSMSTQIIDLKNALKTKLETDAVFKVQQVGVGTCLGISGENKSVVVQSCDNPDSWKLMQGSQRPGPDAKKQQEKDKGKD